MSEGRLPRERVRLVAGIVVIVAFIALAALAIAASHSSFSVSEPAGASEPLPTVPAVPPLQDISTPLPARVNVVPISTSTAVESTASPAPSTTPDAGAPTAVPASTGKPCAQLSLPAPDKVGGIQSLIRLVPLFGPFSPEAFAMVPAFQPGIDALGPLFPLFEQGLDQAAPVLDLITPPAQQLEEAGFSGLAPLYGPYRQSVLDGEAQLVSYLEPIVASLAQAPGSECLVALEGLIASLPPAAG